MWPDLKRKRFAFGEILLELLCIRTIPVAATGILAANDEQDYLQSQLPHHLAVDCQPPATQQEHQSLQGAKLDAKRN
jgi:hypothetical protein